LVSSDLINWIDGTADNITVTDDADGSVTLNLGTNTLGVLDAFNGTFLETIDFTITESGGTVTGSLEKDSTGDLTQAFSDGFTTLDCTPAATIDLTAYVGTDAIPKEVFVYILQSAKTTIAASNTDWPDTEHIKIANLVLRSAATTGTDGALVNRNWNDHAMGTNSQGHITHIEERLRQEHSQWTSGVSLTLKDSTGAAMSTTDSSTAIELVTSEGAIYQLHKQTFPATDMYATATDDAHIVNQVTDEGGAYATTTDLVTDITRYVDGSAAGGAIAVNKYFNIVVWGVQNRTGEASHIMINLPTGVYATEANALSDADGYSVYDIPDAFKGTGFLIGRLTFRLIAGSQWTYIGIEDLRGKMPGAVAGVSVSTTDHGLLSSLTYAASGHTGFQAEDASLTSIAGLTYASASFIKLTAEDTYAVRTLAEVRTDLGLVIGTDVQAWDASLDSIAALTYVSDSYIKVTAEDTYAIRTLAEVKTDLSLNLVENTAISTWVGSANVTTLGTIGTGTWEATDVGIAHGGTGQSTAQAAINALTAVSGATNEHVLTKDTATGNAIFKAAAGGGDDEKVGIDSAATAGYLGAAYNDGVLRTGTGLTYTDGGDFVTLATNGVVPYDTASADMSSYDVSDIGVLFVDSSGGNKILYGLSGGVQGQVLHVVKTSSSNTISVRHNHAGQTQKIFTYGAANLTLSTYECVTLVCTGSSWRTMIDT
jgi:hypothetical protein